MFCTDYDVVVIGGGPAGLAAAVEAKKTGVDRVLIIERDFELGGILKQCIHTGFGLKLWNRELTGPEYAALYIKQVVENNVDVMLDTMVLQIEADSHVYAVNGKNGVLRVGFKALVLSMGCRERTRGTIALPGVRPAGIFTAGTAQRFVNILGFSIGKRIVILGSGDIGMIMARRLTLEGCKVEAVVEILPYLSGLCRNKVQCLDDFGIPLYLGHTIVGIKGGARVESVTVAAVDESKVPVEGTCRDIECDTLLLSVGLIPENEISRDGRLDISEETGGVCVNQWMETSKKGIFACGNVVHVNDLVDNVTLESCRAGRYAGLYALGKMPAVSGQVVVCAGKEVCHVVPQKLVISNETETAEIYFRARRPSSNVVMEISSGGRILVHEKAKRVNPGEMQCLTIDSRQLPEISDELVVEMKEV